MMMKSLSSAFLIAMMVSGFALAGVVHFGMVQASTDVTGIIYSDTAWTKANSPYSLTGNVLVSNGVTLTIEAGATVNLNDFYIMVNGTLRAQGSGTDKIHFNGGEITFTQYGSDWNEQTGSGCIIENANLDSTYVSISFVSPKINSNSISKITIGGSTILTNNTISQKITASSVPNSPIISDNTILDGGFLTISGSAVVSNNIIKGAFSILEGSAVVTNNTVTGNLSASGSGVVSNNFVSGSLSVDGSVAASNNTVSGTLHAGGTATVADNIILDGVSIVKSDLVTISNNTINGGIDLSPWGNNKVKAYILNNTITGGEIGIRLAPTSHIFLYASSRSDAIISGNIISDCATAGIQVNGAGMTQGGYTPLYNTAIIEGNTIINTNCGIDVTGREDVRNNIIAYNEIGVDGGSLIGRNLIVNNTYGIKGGDEIRNNTIANNSVGVESGFSTLVYNNIYNNSGYNVRFLSSTNANATYNWWGTTDLSKINQTIYDFKYDFYLGKVAFVPFLTEPNPEAMPIPEFPDTKPPVISVISPENKAYAVTNVSLAFTVNETASWFGYSLDGQAIVTIIGNTTLNGLSDGFHNLTVYATDIFGNIGSSVRVHFTIDTTLPSISILSPQNKTYDTTGIPLNFTVNEPVSWIAYSLDGQTNVTITGNTTLTGLSDGSHILRVYAKDTAGNTGTSETIHFKIEPFPTTWIVTAIAIVVVVGAAFLVYFVKIKKTTGKTEIISEGVM